jgi:hypothetical protein
MKTEQKECSGTLIFKPQMPGNNPEESIQHSEHGESLKSRIIQNCFTLSLKTFWHTPGHGLIYDHLFLYPYHLTNEFTLSSL